MILDCDPNAMAQNVRLVCMGGTDQSKCDHLMDQGPAGKLVRLPDNCGKGPFAVVGKAYIHPDQSLPAAMKLSLRKRGVAAPTVRGLSIHMDWHTVKPGRGGPIKIEILGYNTPGRNTDTSLPLNRKKLAERGFFSDIGNSIVSTAESAGSAVAGAASTVGNAVEGAASTVGDAASQAASTVGNAVTGAASAVGDAASQAASTVGNAASEAASAAGQAVQNVGTRKTTQSLDQPISHAFP